MFTFVSDTGRSRIDALDGKARMTPTSVSLSVLVDAPILVVDDDAALRQALEQALQFSGRTTATVADGGEAIAWLKTAKPSLVLLDLSLPVMAGEDVAAALHARYGETIPIVVMSAGADASVRAHRVGAYEVLHKPFDLAELLDVVQYALRHTARQDGH